MKNDNNGFTVIEVIVVIAIVCTVALIATPSVKQYYINSQIENLKADIEALENAGMMYYFDHGEYPINYEDLEDFTIDPIPNDDNIISKLIMNVYASSPETQEAEQDNKVVALAGTILPKDEKCDDIKSMLLNNIQLFDYLSSFHGERGALSLLNTVLIIPGAFGFFNKWALLELEGYPQDVLAEDGILTVRLHEKKNAKIKLVPEAISYTQVPSTFADLRKQRIRWFKGLTELLSLFKNTWKNNKKLSLVFLDYFFIEWLTPVMIPVGIFVLISNPMMITYPLFYVFMLLAIVTPIIQGILCLMMESSYRKVKLRKLVYLPLAVFISPLMVLWRNDALLDLRNRNWGFIKRY